MAAHSRVVYIFIENLDFQDELLKQEQKHIRQYGEASEFTFVKYKGNSQFEYTQNGMNKPGLPSIDEDTKIVIMGHGVPNSHMLSQLSSGGGIQLTAQTIANALADKIPAGRHVRISLRGCNTGVGEARDSHNDSFAGKLFVALLNKGLKPELSASLSVTRMIDTGQLGRHVAIREVHSISGYHYERLARSVYQDNPRTLEDFEKFQVIQAHRRIVADTKARGSKVLLTETEGTMKENYPYGKPSEAFDVNQLGDTGKVFLARLLGKEALLVQKFKDKMGEVKEELSKIFAAFEAEHLDIEQTVQYSQLKQFLLAEDYYYFDVKIIEKWILDGCGEIEDRDALLLKKIRESEILTRFKIDHNDIEEIYNYDGKNPPDFDLAYLEFGLDVVLGQGNYSSPISPEQLAFLDEATQQKLLIALGKQMMMPGYTLDKKLIQECIAQYEEKQYWSSGIESLREEGLEEVYTKLLDESIQQKFVIELGKQGQWQDCDQAFVQECKDLMRAKFTARGEELIHQDDSLLKSLNFLKPEQQEMLVLFIGWQNLAGSLSEDAQITMENLIELASTREQLAASPQKRKESNAVSRFSFLPPTTSFSNQGDQQPGESLISFAP